MQSPALKLNNILLTVQDNRNECGSVLMFFGKKILAATIMTPILAAVTFLSPAFVYASVSNVTFSGLTQDSYGTYLTSENPVTFNYDISDTASSSRVYMCTAFATGGACNEVDGTINPISSGHSSSVVTFPSISPEAYSYIAVVLYGSGGGYLTEYNINSYVNGGLILSDAQFGTTTPDELQASNSVVFGTVVAFFLGLGTSLWIYKTISA